MIAAMQAPLPIRCICGHVLADRAADMLIVKHKGRELVFRELLAARCERCGTTWSPPNTESVVR